MCSAEDDVNYVGKFRDNLRQGIEHVLDSLVGREQAKRKKYYFAFYSKLILKVCGVDEIDVRNTMRDEIDLGPGA